MTARKLVDKKYGTKDLTDLSEFIIPLSSAINMMEEYAAQAIADHDAGVCVWREKGNIEGVCDKKQRPIFSDLFKEAQDNIGHITYCPFCGRKIKRIPF